jgi:hypothetical protein
MHNIVCAAGQAESNEMAPRNGMAGMDLDRPRMQVGFLLACLIDSLDVTCYT